MPLHHLAGLHHRIASSWICFARPTFQVSFSVLVGLHCRCPRLPSMTNFFPRRWFPANFFLLGYTIRSWYADSSMCKLSFVSCGTWNVDYSIVITHSSLHQAWPEVSSFGLLENCTAAVPDRLNPLLRKRLRVSCPFRDDHTGFTQQVLCSFFVLPTFLQFHYDMQMLVALFWVCPAGDSCSSSGQCPCFQWCLGNIKLYVWSCRKWQLNYNFYGS